MLMNEPGYTALELAPSGTRMLGNAGGGKQAPTAAACLKLTVNAEPKKI